MPSSPRVRFSSSSPLVAAVVAAASLMASAPAQAAPGDKPGAGKTAAGKPRPAKPADRPAAAAASTDADADALIDQAGEQFESGHLAEALDRFKRAHALRPDTKLLYAMARIEVELGDCAAALEHLRQFMASNPGRKAAAAATEQGAACKPGSTSQLATTTPPAPAEPVASARPPAPAEPTAPAPASTSPSPADAPLTATAATTTVDGAARARLEYRPWYTDVLGDTLAGVGVASLGAGGAMWAISYRAKNEKASSLAENDQLVTRSHNYAIGAYVAGGVGVALLAGGIVRYLTRDGHRRVEVATAPVGREGWAVALSGSF